MKIAILVYRFPPKQIGGTEIATHNIARLLAERGHSIHVVTTRDVGLPSYEMEGNLHIHRISIPRKRGLDPLLYCVKAFLKARQINPDLVHAQAISPTGLSAYWISRLLRIPYIVWCRGFDIYTPWRFKEVISSLVLQNATKVLALSEDMAGRIGEGVLVLPNGIDLGRFEGLPDKELVRTSLGLDQDEELILYVGSLRRIKGTEYLLEAMTIIKRVLPTVKLLLVGHGDSRRRQELENLADILDLPGNVTFVGGVPNASIPRYMAASDVFVLPSLSESFGIVLLEAMASGLPIVATKVGGIPETITDEDNGFLVEPSNPEEIAQKVLLLLKEDLLRQEIGARNKKKAQQYSWETIVDELEEVYYKCLR